ncbi:MAG: hypothetical protein R2705_08900 [Ilumatobacteraceae bacterium]
MFDGEAAPDELVVVEPGLDHGWPACVGDRIPVVQFGGTAQGCAASPPSLAVFEPGRRRPRSRWFRGSDPARRLPWNRGLVVTVPIERAADAPGNSEQNQRVDDVGALRRCRSPRSISSPTATGCSSPTSTAAGSRRCARARTGRRLEAMCAIRADARRQVTHDLG